MDPSTRWFLLLAMTSVFTFWLGVRTARKTTNHGRVGLIICILLMGVWAWLLHNPSVAVWIIPVSILSRIEGTAGVPLFMYVIGIAWGRANRVRQKRLVAWAVILGVVYFLQGGLWLLQSTPSVGFAKSMNDKIVRQSQDYSCVAAACATTLNKLGVPTSEAEMAVLTDTRPGTGSTLLRAFDGFEKKLAGTGYQPRLIELPFDQVDTIPTPALTPLQFESTRRHMVTIMRVTSVGAWIADPSDGWSFYTWSEFREVYTGQVIVMESDSRIK